MDGNPQDFGVPTFKSCECSRKYVPVTLLLVLGRIPSSCSSTSIVVLDEVVDTAISGSSSPSSPSSSSSLPFSLVAIGGEVLEGTTGRVASTGWRFATASCRSTGCSTSIHGFHRSKWSWQKLSAAHHVYRVDKESRVYQP